MKEYHVEVSISLRKECYEKSTILWGTIPFAERPFRGELVELQTGDEWFIANVTHIHDPDKKTPSMVVELENWEFDEPEGYEAIIKMYEGLGFRKKCWGGSSSTRRARRTQSD